MQYTQWEIKIYINHRNHRIKQKHFQAKFFIQNTDYICIAIDRYTKNRYYIFLFSIVFFVCIYATPLIINILYEKFFMKIFFIIKNCFFYFFCCVFQFPCNASCKSILFSFFFHWNSFLYAMYCKNCKNQFCEVSRM